MLVRRRFGGTCASCVGVKTTRAGWPCDGKPCVDVAGVVAELGEGETVSGDEVIECVLVARPSDANELNVTHSLWAARAYS